MRNKNRLLALLLVACLPELAITCLPVKDNEGRKKQIKNASNSVSQHLFLKKIEKIKENIEKTQQRVYALQDSINQSLFRSSSVKDLKFAQINSEVKGAESLKNDVGSYLTYQPTDAGTRTIQNAYASKDPQRAAEEFSGVLNTSISASLPRNMKQARDMEANRRLAQHGFLEFADQRALQAATVMRQWADTYRDKAAELNQLLLRNGQFTMTDYERIALQKEAEKYATLSYEFIEKSDSITLAVQEREDRQKRKAELALQRYNSLVKFYNK